MIFPPNRIVTKTFWMIAGLCLAHGVTQAQAIWLPGSDPVNIARSGVGVAYGRSLEACSLNPALLVTLQNTTAYLSGGMEMMSTQLTLQSNERVLYSNDRNRFVPAFGVGWRATPKLALGIKTDTPFQRHVELPMESSARFFGQAIDLKSLRTELQAAYAVNEAFSIGVSIGMTRLDYSSALSLRALVPSAADLPVSETNPAEALVETTARQEGSVSAVSYSLGFRYAVNSRWTLGGSFQSGVKGRPDFKAYLPSRKPDIYNTRGFSSPPPPIGIEEQAQKVLEATSVHAGTGDLAMPYSIQVGVRQRFNQLMTWEVDLRYIGASAMKIPNQPWLDTPNGQVSTLEGRYEFKDGLAISAMMELNLSKKWVSRCGFSLEPSIRSDDETDAMIGGSKSAGFSLGFGYQIFGGELSAGYQFRQAMNMETRGMEGVWSDYGLSTTGTLTRVEGMGHLWSVGFRKSF